MPETTADVRREIELTRERMSETIAALDERVSASLEGVKRRVDLGELVREHPWPALGAALGAGALLGALGADRRAASATADAASATADAARRAPRTVADATRRGAGAVATKVRAVVRGGDSGRSHSMQGLAGGSGGRRGLLDRLGDALADALESSELMHEIRRAAAELGEPRR